MLSLPSIRVLLLSLCTLLFCTTSALAQEVSPQEKSKIKSLGRELQDMKRSLKATKTKKSRSELSVLQTVRRVRGAKKNPESLLIWVRNNIKYEPYVGSLRGAYGTLVSRRGNAVDQALLLQALYQEAGFDAKLAWGRASSQDAQSLLKQISPESFFASRGNLIDDPSYHLFPSRHVRAAREHMWVEVRRNAKDRYLTVDPLLGTAIGTTSAKKEGSGSLPQDLQGTLTMSLQATLTDGRSIDLLTVEGPLSGFAKNSLHLSFRKDQNLKGAVRPMLRVGGQMKRGEYFPAGSLNTLVVKSRVRIGSEQYILNQPLHELQKDKLFTGEILPHLSIMVVPHWVDHPTLQNSAAEKLKNTMSQLQLLLKERRQGLMKSEAFNEAINGLYDLYSPAIATSLLGHTDRAARTLARTLGVNPVMERPRLVFVAMSRHGDQLFTEVDVQGYRVDALANRGIPDAAAQAFVTMYGRMDNEIRAFVLKAHFAPAPYSTSELFQQAKAKKTSVLTLHPSRKKRFTRNFKGSSKAQKHLLSLVRQEDGVFLIPKQPVQMGNRSRLGWWHIDPVYGSVTGEGWHGLFDLGLEDLQPPKVNQIQVFETLVNHLGSASALWQSSLSTPFSRGPQICSASQDLRGIARISCAKKKALSLPKLKSCLNPGAKSSSPKETIGSDDPLSLDSMGTGQGPGLSCKAALAPMHCGVVVANAFLKGFFVATPKEEIMEDVDATWKPVRCK